MNDSHSTQVSSTSLNQTPTSSAEGEVVRTPRKLRTGLRAGVHHDTAKSAIQNIRG